VTVAVLVPWRPDPDRQRLWDWLKPRWPHPVIEGTPQDGPWRKAEAVQTAAEHTDANIVIVADADVWCDNTSEAVQAVTNGAAWAAPHLWVHRLTPQATDAVLAGEPFDGQQLERPRYRGVLGGGIVVLPRQTLLDVPLDRRFAGWGQEDEAWEAALTVLAGKPWRGRHTLWHLWHPPQERMTRRVGSTESRRLANRYREAWRHANRGNPEPMRRLVEEAR
jgi:hypothetical protein